MTLNLVSFLGAPLTLGDVQVVGSLTIAPIFGSHAPARLLSLDEAIPLGAEAREMPGGADVGHILVSNPTNHVLLLVDGEEVVGAQQNRIIDGTMLVGPGVESRVQVCCIEKGRWQSDKHEEAFGTSRQVMSPTLRGVKSRSARRTGRGDQDTVWRQVEHTVTSTGTRTSTGAMTAVFEQHDEAFDRLASQVRCVPGQIGMVVGVGSHIWGIDLIADPTTFARMRRRILRGYAADATRVREPAALSRAELELALRRLLERPVELAAIHPMDHTFRFRGEGLAVEGSATVHGERLIAMSALLPGAPQGAVAVDERTVRTSETDPIEVSWLASPRGRVGLTFAPGKTAPSMFGRAWSRDLRADLTRLRAHHGVQVMVCLLEDAEFERLGIGSYVAEVEGLGFDLHRLPIPDARTPRSKRAVRRLVGTLRARLKRDETVLIHCAGGLGRAGTIAGCLLIELGMRPDDALEALRARHATQCPENDAQRAFVRGYESRRSALVG